MKYIESNSSRDTIMTPSPYLAVVWDQLVHHKNDIVSTAVETI